MCGCNQKRQKKKNSCYLTRVFLFVFLLLHNNSQHKQIKCCVYVCSSQLIRPGFCESEWSSSFQLSIYQHADCPASWCLLGWRGRLGKARCHSGGRWEPPSGIVMPAGTGETVSKQHDLVEREGEKEGGGGILIHACANPDKLDKASSGLAQ